MNRTLCLIAILCFTLLPEIAHSQQNTLEQWPPFPKADPVTIQQQKELPQTFLGQIKWLSKTSTWVQECAPAYLRDKAFEFLAPIPGVNGRIVTLATVSPGDGKNYNVFTFRKIKPTSSSQQPLEQVFYTMTSDGTYAPLFSPDGNSLVFNIGYLPDERISGHGNMLWNMKVNTLRMFEGVGNFSPRLFPRVLWSPGGRYLSLLSQGDAFGEFSDEQGQPYASWYRLDLYDAHTGLEKTLAHNINTDWSWTHHASLLYSPTTPQQASQVNDRVARPSIYEVDCAKGQSHKLFDGGYYALESPDGQWVVFADWPGPLLEAENEVPDVSQKQIQAGLYLFNRRTNQRQFVGALPVQNFFGRMQWLPDSHTLFVSCNIGLLSQSKSMLWRLSTDRPKLEEVGVWTGSISFRGTSSDGRYIYASRNERIEGPKPSAPGIGYIHTRHTLTFVESATGKQTDIAHLFNYANENPDWDFHDDSGLNPAFVAAQKIEEALPAIGDSSLKAPLP